MLDRYMFPFESNDLINYSELIIRESSRESNTNNEIVQKGFYQTVHIIL